MKDKSVIFTVCILLVLALVLNATTLFTEPTNTSFIQTAQAAVTITTSITEAPYSSQYYYMNIELNGVSLGVGDSIQMNFPQEQCYFGDLGLSLRCYDSFGSVPSIPPKEGDDLIQMLFKISCFSGSTPSTAPVPDGGKIRCLVYNNYRASITVLENQVPSIQIGDTLYTGSDIFSSTFYAAKPVADFFQVSIGDKTMKTPFPITNFNNEEVSASLRVDQLVIGYLEGLPPNLKISLDMKAIFTTTTDDTCKVDFSSFLASFLPSAYNHYASVFSPTSDVPLINQPAQDIGVFFDGTILYLFTGPNPDQKSGSISIPISMQVAFLVAQEGIVHQIPCFHAFTTSYQELKSATLSIGTNPGSYFNDIVQSLDYLITRLNQVPVEFTAGTQSLSYSVADDRMVLERTNGIVYVQEVYDLELLTGYTNRNYDDFFSQFDAIQGGFTQLLSTPAPSAIDSNSFADHKLTAITPNTLSFSQADLELRFARLMDQDGVTLTPVTPSILTYSLYQREYTVGYVPIPAFTPLASNSNIQIQVSNTKAIMSAQFALSAESSDVFAPTAEFSVDAIFTLRPHRLMGELFPQAHPIPVCSFVGAPATLRIMPHVYSPTGADIHTTAGIRIAGTMPWNSKITIKCEQDIIPGLKTGDDDLLALPWVLRLYSHRVYVQKPIDVDVLPTYDASWNKQEVLATSPLIKIEGPGIDNEDQFNFIIGKVVAFVQNLAPKEDSENKMFGQFTSSDLQWAWIDYPQSNGYSLKHNYYRQHAYPTDPTHLSSTQTLSTLTMIPNIYLDPQFTWKWSYVIAIYPELSLKLSLTISFDPSFSDLVRYPNSLTPNQSAPIPYNRTYALTNFPWFTTLDGPCFSTLQCDLRNFRTLNSWRTVFGLCFEGKCQSELFLTQTKKSAESKTHIFNPQKRRPDEFKMTGKVNISGANDIIIRGANEFGFGYVAPKFALQFTSVFAISLDTMINEQHVIIDNDNNEYQSIVGKKYTIQLLSFLSTPTGDIIFPTSFHVHWTSSSSTIPTAETLSHLNIPAKTISAIGASNMKFRVTYPDLLTAPTTANPNPLTYLDSVFFTSMASCMAPPEAVSNYSDPSQWTNQCKNGGQCQSTGCKCANGYRGSLCDSLQDAPNTFSVSLNLDTGALIDLSPQQTVYFRIGLISAPDGLLPSGFDADRDVLIWLTATFFISSSQADLPSSVTSPKKITSHFIPDFVLVQILDIEIPSIFGKSIENSAIFIEPINLSSEDILSYRYVMPIPALKLEHTCLGTSNSNSCTDCNHQNWFSNSGCDDFFHNVAYARSSRCSGLRCPTYMSVDYNSCACTCTSQNCKDRTRSTMLYTSPTTSRSNYGKSLYYHQITRELTVILGLNTLPLPNAFKSHRGGFIDQNEFFNLSPLPYVEPLGYEELLVTPMTYTTMDTQAMMITITMTPFDSTTPPNAAQMNDRFAYFTSKLTTLFSAEKLPIFKFFNNNAPLRLDISLVPLPTLNTFEWKKYSSSSSPSQLTTSCKLPTATGNMLSLQKCPTAVQLKMSPYWSKCASTTGMQHISPVCLDLFDRPTLYDPLSPSWCGTSSILYPNFPPTVELPGSCSSEQSFDPPTVINLTLSSPSNLITSGDIVIASWLSIENLNPAHTVSFYLRLGSPPVGGFSIFDSLEDEYYHDYGTGDDGNYNLYHDIDSFAMIDVQQNALEKGYSVLLGTFSISSKIASLTMPVTKTDSSSSVYIFALLNQRKTNQIIATPSSFTLEDRNMCEVSTCSQNAHQECQRSTGACICAPLFRPVIDDSTNVMTCVSICDNQCGQDGKGGTCQEDTGSCKCFDDFSGSRCEVALSCNAQNTNLCSDNGSVRFVAQQCGSECTCFGKWISNGTKQCSQCQYTAFNTTPSLCDQLGTDVSRTEKEKCSQCVCKKGYEGSRCATRTMYGTVTFTVPHADGVDYNQTPLVLSAEAMEALIRDLALSMGVSEDVITIAQVHTTTITSTPAAATATATAATFINTIASILFSPQQVKTNTNAVTFAVSTAMNDNAMNSLYDSWNNLKTNFDQVPISQTEAQQEVGTPAGVQDVYDPVCVSSTEVTCPTGFDPFGEDTTSSDKGGNKTTSAVIAIIVSIVVAVVVIACVGGFLVWAKKNKKCCFQKRTKPSADKNSQTPNKSNGHLELVASNTTNVGRSQFVTESGAIDLIEVELSPGEQALPAGWKKMRHNVTGHTLYVNYTEMQSQKQSPVSDTVTKNGKTDKAGEAGEGYGEGW